MAFVGVLSTQLWHQQFVAEPRQSQLTGTPDVRLTDRTAAAAVA